MSGPKQRTYEEVATDANTIRQQAKAAPIRTRVIADALLLCAEALFDIREELMAIRNKGSESWRGPG